MGITLIENLGTRQEAHWFSQPTPTWQRPYYLDLLI
jgi:hypothetical protein